MSSNFDTSEVTRLLADVRILQNTIASKIRTIENILNDAEDVDALITEQSIVNADLESTLFNLKANLMASTGNAGNSVSTVTSDGTTTNMAMVQ